MKKIHVPKVITSQDLLEWHELRAAALNVPGSHLILDSVNTIPMPTQQGIGVVHIYTTIYTIEMTEAEYKSYKFNESLQRP